MAKVLDWVKKWGLAIIGFIAGLFLLAQKPKWIREKEREIKDRATQIETVRQEADDKTTTYEEAKAKHDEAIEQAQSGESSPGFTDSDSAASFVDDILDKRK